MKHAALVYESKTGNTEKVALAVKKGLEKAGLKVSMMTAGDDEDVDFFSFDLICIGSPSHQWLPIKSIDDLLREKFSGYRS